MALALVTGGSRGIGRAIALDLAGAGFDLILTYNTKHEAAAEVVAAIESKGRKAWAVQLDVAAGEATEKRVTELVTEHGCPDALVNNAGICKDGLFPMMSRDSWESVIDTNLGAFYSVTRPVIRAMLRRRSGRVVNLTSIS